MRPAPAGKPGPGWFFVLARAGAVLIAALAALYIYFLASR